MSACVMKSPSVKRDSRRGRRVVVGGGGGEVILMFSAGLWKLALVRLFYLFGVLRGNATREFYFAVAVPCSRLWFVATSD